MAAVALDFEEMHTPYTSGQEICIQKTKEMRTQEKKIIDK